MAISFKEYVNIVSGVAAGAGVRLRDLILRVFSGNERTPTQSVLEFVDATSVGIYYGTSSQEYKIAVFYFGWISKSITKARKISFAAHFPSGSVPKIFGRAGSSNMDIWTQVTGGAFNLEIGGVTVLIDNLDFNDAPGDLDEIAEIIEDAIHSAAPIDEETEEPDPQFANSTVNYNPVTKSMDFVGGVFGYATISAPAPDSGTDIRDLMGWGSQGVFSYGSDSDMTPVDSVIRSEQISNNFGSFCFEPNIDTEDADYRELEAVAAWTDEQNVRYQFCVPVPKTEAAAIYELLSGYSGVACTISEASDTQFPEIVPGIQLAATDYSRRNSTSNYMFQQFALTPTVEDTDESRALNAQRMNYYGVTQQAGQNLEFYQRGVLMGLSTAPVDMNVFANEQWLKDASGAGIMSMLLSLPKVSANDTGRAQVMAAIQERAITPALFNGTISVGKPLNIDQKAFITQQTGDDLAWHQVQNIGYWFDAVLSSYVTTDSRTEWKVDYVLIYSKDDCVRKVDGSHQLI